MNPALARHLQTLGLERSPFPPTPDADAYYATPLLEGELIEAAQALRTRSGFVLLTGEVGTGKSTFLRRLLGQLENDGISVSLVFNTFLQEDDLLAAILRDFGLAPLGNAATDIELLNRFLVSRWQAGRTCVLIIDDAQNLTLGSLELVRLLTSLETGQEKLLQIVLSGQPELRRNLEQPQIRQLTSRICKHVRLQPLDLAETRAYVDFRLTAAGADGSIRVQPDAAATLHRCSKGNPRRIHLIMDRCLYGLYAQPKGTRRVDSQLIKDAATQSGALPAEAGTRRNLVAVAATLAATGLLGIAGLLVGGSESRADSQSHVVSPSVPESAPTPTTAAAKVIGEPWTDCLRRTGSPQQRLDWVEERTARELQRTPDICIQQHGMRWQIAWSPPDTVIALEKPATVDAALRQLQTRLTALGHYDGDIDGRFGRLTERALSRYQQSVALPATGEIDPLTLLLLQASHASTPPSHSRTTDVPPHGNG